MAVDERLAWGYTVCQIANSKAEHNFSFSHNEIDNAGNWLVPYLLENTIEDTIDNLFSAFSAQFPSTTTIIGFVTYKNQLLPLPTLPWYFGDPVVPTIAPVGGILSAGQGTYTWKTPTGRIVKMTILDMSYPEPQRIPYNSLPAPSQAAMDYVVDHGNIRSIDGQPITRPNTFSYTYNRRLERRYGRRLST